LDTKDKEDSNLKKGNTGLDETDRIEMRIFGKGNRQIDFISFPDLTSNIRWIQDGIDLLHKHAPGFLHLLSRQRIYSCLDRYPVVIHCPPDLDKKTVQGLLQNWIRRKRQRRILFMALELAILPLTGLIAVLPGPNVIFYFLAILFYFHWRAFIKLGRIAPENLNLSLWVK